MSSDITDQHRGVPVGARARGRSIAALAPSEPLLRSAYSLMLNTVLTSGLGMAFWIVAARLYPAEVVGRDSALVAAMMQFSSIALLNLANAIVRFLPGRADAAGLLARAYATSAGAALVIGTAFVLVAPLVADDFAFLTGEPLLGAAFVLAVVLWGIFALQDAALTATRHAPWIPVENGAFGVLKLVALPLLLLTGGAHGIFLAWVIPMCALLLPVNWLLFRRILRGPRRDTAVASAPAPGRRGLVAFLAQDYVATVLSQAGLTLLPLLVVASLGPEANAYFYIPFTIAIAVDVLVFGVATSLVAEGALDPARIPALTRLLVRRLALLLGPGLLVVVVAAPLILLPFGPDYVEESTPLLRLLAVGSVFRAAIALATALWRLEHRGGRILLLDLAHFVLLLGAAAPLGDALGLRGVALAWLGACAVVGACVVPSLARVLRAGAPPPRDPEEPGDPGAGLTAQAAGQ